MNAKKTLLYVDDEAINLMLFEINFKEKFNVLTCDSGFKGLKILENSPDVSIVISDMKMPGMNGIEFITDAKIKFPHIVFYILTGYEITDQISSALENKLIKAFFRKPFDIAEIESVINDTL